MNKQNKRLINYRVLNLARNLYSLAKFEAFPSFMIVRPVALQSRINHNRGRLFNPVRVSCKIRSNSHALSVNLPSLASKLSSLNFLGRLFLQASCAIRASLTVKHRVLGLPDPLG
jgi:hypothetical protein